MSAAIADAEIDYQRVIVKPVGAALGAEVSGVDLSKPLDAETVAELRRAFLAHLVLFFRDQNLSPAQLRDFSAYFGEIAEYPFAEGMPDCKDVVAITKEPHQTSNFGGDWHSDTTYTECPPSATVLQGVEIPENRGDTLFANMYLAHERLSKGTKDMIDGLRAVNTAQLRAAGIRGDHLGSGSMKGTGASADTYCNLHPVVRTHPETGRKALYVNSAHTLCFEDMTSKESAPLLQVLLKQVEVPEIGLRFRWTPGAIALWDNRCAQHCALNDYDGFRRVIWRVTIKGDRPA